MAEPVDVFADLIGHGAVVALLRAEAKAPAQAYLFVGPSNAGKASAARRFAATLLCGGDDRCLRRVLDGSHPDVSVIEPEGRSAITVDQARHTVSQASLSPMEGARKVFLFEEGGMLNDEAANALLKTLEEPTRSTIFVLVAETDGDLPETVVSRCRRIVFGRVSEEEIAAGLEAIGVEHEQALQAARISGGRPGLARSLATEPEVADFRRIWLSVPMRLSEHPGDAFVLAEEVAAASDPLLAGLKRRHEAEAVAGPDEGAGSKLLRERHERAIKRVSSALFVSGLEILAGFYRDAVAAQYGAPVRNTDLPPKAFTGVHPARAMRNAARTLATIDVLRANQRPQLALADLFADLGGDT